MGLSAVGGLRRFAFARPHAFPIIGWGGRTLWAELAASHRVVFTPAPRNADLLVLCGEIPAQWGADVRALFETLALPRAVLWLAPPWPCSPPAELPIAARIRPGEPDAPKWRRLREMLLDPDNPANRPLLPDMPPNPWRGRGDHGQGGVGMMGGAPYGRPMAMPDDDVDDLMLDDVPTFLGPFFPALPPGLEMKLRAQGDRIRRCERVTNRFPAHPLNWNARGRLGTEHAPVVDAALGRPVPISAVEAARVTSHLRWIADFLDLTGLGSYAARLRALGPRPNPARLARVLTAAERTGLHRLCQGVGIIDRNTAEAYDLAGPVARACGLARDVRIDDDAYAASGFRPQLENSGDVWARWRVRVRETLQSLNVLSHSNTLNTAVPEGPHGAFHDQNGALHTPGALILPLISDLVAGLEWSEAIIALASLDLDMAEAALYAPDAAP